MISLGSIEKVSIVDIIEIMRYHKIRSIAIDTSKTGLEYADSYHVVSTEWYGAKTTHIEVGK